MIRLLHNNDPEAATEFVRRIASRRNAAFRKLIWLIHDLPDADFFVIGSHAFDIEGQRSDLDLLCLARDAAWVVFQDDIQGGLDIRDAHDALWRTSSTYDGQSEEGAIDYDTIHTSRVDLRISSIFESDNVGSNAGNVIDLLWGIPATVKQNLAEWRRVPHDLFALVNAVPKKERDAYFALMFPTIDGGKTQYLSYEIVQRILDLRKSNADSD
jgi:hypothetical protein